MKAFRRLAERELDSRRQRSNKIVLNFITFLTKLVENKD
jgi:hypothetical protein